MRIAFIHITGYNSQDRNPATGVWRVRDVNPQAEQYRFGGGSDDLNHTRIIDYAWPVTGIPSQESMLATYKAIRGNSDGLKPDDYPRISMILSK